MPDLPKTESPAAEAAAAAEAEATAAATEAAATEEKPDPYAGLPEEFSWMKNEVETTRREAASYRTQLREEQEKLKNAKTPEEVASILADREAVTAKLEREVTIERLARKFKLDDDKLEFLVGKTEEDLTRQAEKLSKLGGTVEPTPPPTVQVTKVPLSGGTKPGDDAPALDGRQAWRDYRKNR